MQNAEETNLLISPTGSYGSVENYVAGSHRKIKGRGRACAKTPRVCDMINMTVIQVHL